MTRIEKLKEKIDTLYRGKNPARNDWADWFHENHIFLVADKAKSLAIQFGANTELAEASGMLHDIADAKMSRFDPTHEEESEKMARSLLEQSGFNKEEVYIVVEDAIRYHECPAGKIPVSLEGKVMTTADAVVHLSSNFYMHGIKEMKKTKSPEEIKKWGLPKIEEDFHIKILFNETRESVRKDYERAKTLFDFLEKQ